MVATPVLIVRQPWADLLLDGDKRAEVRSTACPHVGKLVYVSVSGPGGAQTVVGKLRVTQSEGPVSGARFTELQPLHLVTPDLFGYNMPDRPYRHTHVWHVADAERLPHPLPCPRKGCVTWAKFDEEEVRCAARTYAARCRTRL